MGLNINIQKGKTQTEPYLSPKGLASRNLLVGKAWKKAVDGLLFDSGESDMRKELPKQKGSQEKNVRRKTKLQRRKKKKHRLDRTHAESVHQGIISQVWGKTYFSRRLFYSPKRLVRSRIF